MYTPPARDIFGDDGGRSEAMHVCNFWYLDVVDKQLAPQHVLRDPAECPYAADGE